MTKCRTYDGLFSALDGGGERFEVVSADAELRQALTARLADDGCLGAERFFGAREDIVATARVREVRRYAKGAKLYVRYEFKVLDTHGDWSGRYQLLAVFSKSGKLDAYTIVRGRTRKELVPSELKVNDSGYVYVARELKRALMKAKRLGREMSVRTLEKIGIDLTHDRREFRIAIKDLTWKNVCAVWRRHGYFYRDNLLMYLALRGDTNAQCEVAFWFDMGKEKSEYWSQPDLAEYWYRRAADAGNPMGQINLATLWSHDCDRMSWAKRNEMMELVRAAAAQDFPAALLRLSHCCHCGRCGVINEKKAAEYGLRYMELEPLKDNTGRLAIHRNTRYGKITKELVV